MPGQWLWGHVRVKASLLVGGNTRTTEEAVQTVLGFMGAGKLWDCGWYRLTQALGIFAVPFFITVSPWLLCQHAGTCAQLLENTVCFLFPSDLNTDERNDRQWLVKVDTVQVQNMAASELAKHCNNT